MLTIRGIKHETDDGERARRTMDETPLEAKLRAEISALKAKLRPFASACELWPDNERVDDWLVTVRLGDCRAARDAIAPRKL